MCWRRRWTAVRDQPANFETELKLAIFFLGAKRIDSRVEPRQWQRDWHNRRACWSKANKYYLLALLKGLGLADDKWDSPKSGGIYWLRCGIDRNCRTGKRTTKSDQRIENEGVNSGPAFSDPEDCSVSDRLANDNKTRRVSYKCAFIFY